MTTSAVQPSTDAEVQRKRAHRKLLTAGLFGSSIEWYDFFLYGTAAALVFPQVFFPDQSPLMATLLSFSTFWAGFVARPIGGIVAGHYGDKYGRKPAVVVSLLAMGLATFLIGLLPGAAAIGVAAPILLVFLRFVQGLACGGQWGGIVLLLTESSGPKRRGFSGTFGQMGVSFGVLLGNAVLLGATGALSNEAFLSWGWRVPFLASALLFPIVLYIHNKVEDTPEFRELQNEAKKKKETVVSAPLAQAIRDHWRKILLACGLLAATNALFYISIAGVLSYGTEVLDMNRNDMLTVSLLSAGLTVGVVMWSGHMSDKIGRRPMILIGAAAIILWAFPYFMLINTANIVLFFIAVTVGSVFQSMTYGPVAAYIGELFAPNVRYSAASMSYQLAAITVSGGTPFIMIALIDWTGTTTLVSVFIAVMGLVTLLCAWKLRETNPAEVRNDPTAIPGAQFY
ncbi:MFS transporter [Rhodococcus marinonascens]|uniref:MFS transporter n=1 Tax=Rhodococcus marinonascens TaxID=38311 RepID=UPI0009337CB8|nr:MFS transporter [Rhodococcus marinonascens]